MSDTLVNSDNYFVVSGWMINDLHLKGTSLIVYAVIYGFTQNIDRQKFSGSLKYLEEWTQSSKQAVINSLKLLLDRGLIEKEDVYINGVKYCTYRSKKLTPGQESLPGWSKNFTGVVKKVDQGGQKSLPNNIDNNIDNKKENNIGISIVGNTPEAMSEANVGVASDSDRTDYQAVINLYHELCPSFRRVLKISTERKRHIKARFKEGYTLQDFEDMFRKAEMSSFLKGWKGCDFDWLITDRAMPKVLEGKYDNVESPKKEEPQTFGGFVLQ